MTPYDALDDGRSHHSSFAAGACFAVGVLLLLQLCLCLRRLPSAKHQCCHGCAMEKIEIDLPAATTSDEDNAQMEETLLQRFRSIMPDFAQISDEEDWEAEARVLGSLVEVIVEDT